MAGQDTTICFFLEMIPRFGKKPIFVATAIEKDMNIIELFGKLELDRDAILRFTAGDVIRVEKQLNVERKLNPEIDTNTAANLILALRDYADEFVFVLSNRHLYNFFTGKDMMRKYFPEVLPAQSAERVRNFIGRFLSDDLELRLDRAIASEKFGSIRELLTQSDYLPEEALHRLERRMVGKLEFGIGKMPREGAIDTTGINYMRVMSFYEVLSHFSSIEMDEKIRIVINRTADMYNTGREKQFAADVMVCLPSYKAFDDDLNRVTSGNRSIASSSRSSYSGSESKSGVSGRVIFIVIVLIVKLVIVMGRCSTSNSSYEVNNDGYGSGDGIGPIYTYEQRSNDVKVEEFFNYLTMFDRDSVSNIKPVTTIKTGDNPYEGIFNDKKFDTNKMQTNNVKVVNTTPFDVILFEFAGGNLYRGASYAYFIKSGDELSLKVPASGGIGHDYAFYFGNELSAFTSGKAEVERKSSMREYRFRKTAPYCREILYKKFRFSSDLTISKNGGQIRLKSQSLEVLNDSLAKPGEYGF